MEVGRIAGLQTNTTTYFYREAEAIEMVCTHVLRPTLERARPVSIWSAGCASGEEVYSLAMAAQEVGSTPEILGTDINEYALEKAQRAEYPVCRIRNVRAAQRSRWFIPCEGELFRVSEELKRNVRFTRHDLTCDPAPPPSSTRRGGPFEWDVVFCRNVLLYMERPQIEIALSTIATALAPGGLLVLESSGWLKPALMAKIRACAKLELVQIADVYVYRNADITDVRLQGERSPTDLLARTSALAPLCQVEPPSAGTSETTSEETLAVRKCDQQSLREQADHQLDQHKMRAALELYRLALVEDELQAELYLRCGVCHLLLEEPQEAKIALQQSLFLDPALWPAAWLLGELWHAEDATASLAYLAQARNLLRGHQDRAKEELPERTAEDDERIEAVLAPFMPARSIALDAVECRIAELERGR